MKFSPVFLFSIEIIGKMCYSENMIKWEGKGYPRLAEIQYPLKRTPLLTNNFSL